MPGQKKDAAIEEKTGRASLAPAAVLALLVLAQLLLAAQSFRSYDDIQNDKPLVNVDFCSQYYWARAAREFMGRDGRMWGYDPHFMAGYPLSFVFNSSLPVQITAAAFSSANLARVVKLFFLASFALAPLTLYYGTRQFGIAPWPALAAAGLGLALFWTGENALFGHFGMLSGALMLHFFLVPVGLCFRYLRLRQNRALTLFFFAFALSFTIHKTAFVLTLPPALLLFVLFVPTLERRDWGLMMGALVLAGLVNLHWLYPFFKYLPLKIEDPGTTFFQNTDPLRWIKDLWPLPPQQFFALPLARLLILVLGVTGIVREKKKGTALVWTLSVLLGLFFVLVYFGSFAPFVEHLQPYRYVTAFYYLWLPFAGSGVHGLWERFEKPRPARQALAAAFCLAPALLVFLPSFRSLVAIAPLTTELDGPSLELRDWVENNTGRSARLLIEDINVWDERTRDVYGGARFVNLLPLLAPRELVGGPLPNAFIKHHHAGFHDGVLFGRPARSYSDRELDGLMALYNIKWCAAWSEESRQRFTVYPAAREAARFGYITVFELDRDGDFFLEGSGRASSDWNRIGLEGLSTDTGRVVISYHWAEGLESDPPAELIKVDMGGDPVGFIGIKDPPPELTLSLGLARGGGKD